MNADKHRYKIWLLGQLSFRNISFLSVFICVHLWLILLSSCSTKPTDLRTLVPADTLVYLETNDLAAALQPIVDSKPFNLVAKSKPDLSALKGVQLAVAVTGFETTEEKLTDENSVGRVQPRFVAVADTHAWNYQAVKFAELKLGSFVEDIYDSEPTLEKSDKNGGKYFTWKAKDGRKTFALVIDSRIYFGNDESSIEKCLAVKRGEADSIAKTGKVQSASQGTLALGHISTDGIAQIASVIGLKVASEAGDESETQSAIAGIVPQLIRNSITDITWTSTHTVNGIEDKYTIGMPSDVAKVFNETMQPGADPAGDLTLHLPTQFKTATRYNVKDLRIAWRSLLLVSQKQSDAVGGRILGVVSNILLEPYGVTQPEQFLGSIGQQVVTTTIQDGEGVALLGSLVDYPSFRKSISNEILLPVAKEDLRINLVLRSADNEYGFVFLEWDNFIVGDPTVIEACLKTDLSESELGMKSFFGRFTDGKPVTVSTIGRDRDQPKTISELLIGDSSASAIAARSLSETRFTKTGMERRTVSDFGLIGSIIAQLAADQ